MNELSVQSESDSFSSLRNFHRVISKDQFPIHPLLIFEYYFLYGALYWNCKSFSRRSTSIVRQVWIRYETDTFNSY